MARRRALLCSSSAHSFVNQAESFRSVFTTAGTMFLILLGEFDYDEMKQEIAEISPRCPAKMPRRDVPPDLRDLSDSPPRVSIR